ncbi:hypothetical protein CONCODRAFT_9589 [Conidiobolus coronatus NRRL 28638]|uniref:Chaplin domain-containing protein n=1 Tax=Conidiobolus coronatus (strain ATCC 28846 / CBS 209.66 / NRRL 28638) TaxID=796925 RepID=A0A137NZL8_CONC2|nr:hypothetical protein CONCODRAFT_9589 [Conidiobolus coronatus NRRL 28638]|eukprot:KXN68207.1 hypothetical protein CONCODRAFT_9589 [Conidiobolus coronatus NRRL 28638]
MNFIITIISLASITYGHPYSDTGAHGIKIFSHEVLPGKEINIPINVPIHFCGSTLEALAFLGPEFAKTCVNDIMNSPVLRTITLNSEKTVSRF